jgi:hypothetical protein
MFEFIPEITRIFAPGATNPMAINPIYLHIFKFILDINCIAALGATNPIVKNRL